MSDLRLILTQGLPASGKTTKALEWVDRDPAARARVGRDPIRRMLGYPPKGDPDQEDRVTRCAYAMTVTLLAAGISVIRDDLFLRPEFIVPYRELAELVGARFAILSTLDVPLQICIDRDRRRPTMEQVAEIPPPPSPRVGREVILQMWSGWCVRNFEADTMEASPPPWGE